MDREGVRDLTMAWPFAAFPLCPGHNFRLLQSVADSAVVVQGSVLMAG